MHSSNERLLLGNYWNQETGFVRGKHVYLTFTFNHLADAFIQSNLQMNFGTKLLNKTCRFEHSTHL